MSINNATRLHTCVKATIAMVAITILVTAIALAVSPEPTLYSRTKNSQAYYSNEGKLLRLTLSDDGQYRLGVDLTQVPPDFQKATLQYEDQHFYSHFGVNVLSLARATYNSYFTNGRRMGASTVTMQLARLRFGLHTKSVSGKLAQIWHALILERHFTKQQILEAYLNLAPYGHNIQGVAAASLIYFHKDVTDLTTSEALLLAVVPQNPNARSPSTQTGMRNASAARERLLKTWLENTSLSDIDRNNLSLPLQAYSPKDLPFQAPHFVDQLIAERAQHVETLQLPQTTQTDTLTTTLSLNMQRKLEHLTKTYIEKNRSKGLENTAVMVIDYSTMGITAEVGSADYFDASIFGQVNGTRALRSPGSTLKPFIYALGLEQGLIHPSSLLTDTPKRFNAYSPENYDKQFIGPISARDALVRSRNIPAVSLMNKLKNPSFHEWLAQTKPRRLESESHYGLALALGGNEVSMLELMQWYAALANHGRYSKAVSFAKKPNDTSQQPAFEQSIMSAEASFITLQMLSSNPETNPQLGLRGLSTVADTTAGIPWKTGTSFAFRDAWSIGVVGNYVVGVWVGNFDGSANPALIGRTAAGPLFFQIAKHLQQSTTSKQSDWRDTSRLTLKKVDVCITSGDLETEHCPEIQPDWFIPGVSPIKSNRVFREIPIDIASGLRACRPHTANTQLTVFEFWPSDIQQVFRRAGIAKKKPPPFMPECDDYAQADNTDAPEITSPSPNLSYALQSDRLSVEQIPLTATVASDARILYWFIDNQFIGQSKPDVPIFWNPKQGDYQVTVIDDVGRSSHSTVRAALVN